MPIRYRCRVCGKITAGRRPRASWEQGDGSLMLPRRHNAPPAANKADCVAAAVGKPARCRGIFEPAIAVYEDGREYDFAEADA